MLTTPLSLLALASPVLCQATDEGPCRLPEAGRLLPGADAAPVVVANFGLLFPPTTAGGGWQYLCDDLYRSAPPERVWRAGGAAGARLFAGGEAPAQRGLLVSQDGCSWRPLVTVMGQSVVDLVFVEGTPAMFALGVAPVAVHASDDGGASFRLARAFSEASPPARLVLAPSSQGRRLYLGARAADGAVALWASADGGDSWRPSAVRPPGLPLAVAPDDPEVLYFLRGDARGDELWRSGDGGATTARVLKLSDFELHAGLAFGADAATLYVAGRAPVVVDDVPPGRLYISRDRGDSWLPPVRSGPRGPAYRCLDRRDGRLWACGAGESAGEDFMLGVSVDEGQTWSPVLRLADVRGARACARAACVVTENWLCEGFGSCAGTDDGGGDGGAPGLPDTGAGRPRVARVAGGGCDCALAGGAGGPSAGAASSGLTVVALAGLVFFARLRRKIAAADTHPKRGDPGLVARQAPAS